MPDQLYQRSCPPAEHEQIAAVGITVSLLVSGLFLTDLWWVRLILAAVGVYALWFVFSRPTRAPDTV